MSTTDSTVSAVHNPARRRKNSKDLEPPLMRIILLGKDVSANSRVGNFMLGRSAFDSEAPPDDHQIERVRGKDMMIINCPHLLQLNLSDHQIIQTVRKCVDLSHPGPHIILLIFKPDECSREDQERLEMILNYFSDNVYEHTLVLTTHDSHSVHQTEVNDNIQKIIKKSFNRHYRLKRNCTAPHLIETFRDIVKSNDGCYLIYDKYKDSQSFTVKQQTDERDLPEMRDDVRIVLLGKTGVGKSATGNTILNRQAFISEVSVESVTSECQKQTAEINNRLITVIDTPGLFDTERSHEEIKREMMNCISMILPGPHVFIIVLSLAQRFTEEESTSVKIIQEMFGENSLMFTMVLFTRGDQLRNKTIEECLGKPGSVIRNLLEECGNRYHVFNNNLTEDQTQVSLLLEKIDDMVKTNGGSYYSSKIFREMEREKHQQQIKKLMERIEQLSREKEEQEREMRDEMRRDQESFKNETKKLKKENKDLLMKYETQTDKLMNTIENHERERKRREDEFREREERYKSEIERSKKQTEEEKLNQDKEKKKREEEFRQREEEYKTEIKEKDEHVREMKDEMRRDKNETDELKKENKDLQIKYETQTEQLMNTIENHERERKRREDEFREREERYKREIKEKEEQERQMRDEMRRERETFKNKTDELKQQKEELINKQVMLQSKYDTEIKRIMMDYEKQNVEVKKKREKEYNEREKQYNTEIKEMKREREECERRKREENEKMREREREMWAEYNQRLKQERDERQKENEKHEREKERIEREKKDQLEEFEKRIQEERNMREVQEKIFKDKLKLMKEEKEDELKRRRTEMTEEYEEILVCRRLKTEYSKWACALYSAMLEIENKLQNKIQDYVIHEIEEQDLQRELKVKSEEVEKSMSDFFEKYKDQDILIQRKSSYKIKITELQESIIRKTKRKLNEILQQRDLKRKIDAQRTQHENNMLEKQRHRDKTNYEETLKTEIDLFWKPLMNEIIQNTPPITDIDVLRDVKILLSDLYESVPVENIDIFIVQSYSDYVQLKRFRGITSYVKHVYKAAKEKFVSVLSKEDEKQIKTFILDVTEETDKMIKLFNISKMGYNISYIQQLTDHIKTRITEYEEESLNYEFKNEFFIDLVFSILKRAEKTFTDQHRMFREVNDPVLYVEKYIYEAKLTIFGEIIHEKLKELIEQSLYKQTARDLADEIRSNCPSLNGNRSNLEKHILKRLAEEENFDKYINYIHNPKDHFKSFIRDEVHQYIRDQFSIRVKPKMKYNIKVLQQKILTAAHESTEDVQVKSGDVDLWLKFFTQKLSDVLIFSMKVFSGLKHDDVDYELLEDVIKTKLSSIISDISREFSTNTFDKKLDLNNRPDEIVIDHFCRCCWVQCPFCKAICTNTIENHYGDHSVPFHRVHGINGWSYSGTTNLSVSICTTEVASNQYFYTSYGNRVLYREYRRAGPGYANWSISPDLSELPYWKWFVCRFQRDLEIYYKKTFQGKGKIPDEWRRYTKQEAIESLDKYIK